MCKLEAPGVVIESYCFSPRLRAPELKELFKGASLGAVVASQLKGDSVTVRARLCAVVSDMPFRSTELAESLTTSRSSLASIAQSRE